MTLVCGVEEAGRGPIIGPLVMCGLVIKEEDEQKLLALRVRDSKLMTPPEREMVYDKILEVAQAHKIVIIPPAEIDEALNDPNMNLNWLEATKSAEILNELKPDKAILDCPSPNIPAYTKYIKKKLDKDINLHCAHHADKKYPVVSAASIIAKVSRDREVAKLKVHVGADFGSGYMADEVTKAWVEQNWSKYPEIFRRTWDPYKKLVEGLKQKNLEEF